MKLFFKGITVALFFTIISSGNTNAQKLTEDQVPLNIQSYFYNLYPGAKVAEWGYTKKDDGENLYKVKFTKDSDQISAFFNNDGDRVYENLEYTNNDTPEGIIDHAKSNYNGFKVVGVHRHTNFLNGTVSDKSINYELIVKLGKEVATVWFDQNMNRHDSLDTSNLASK